MRGLVRAVAASLVVAALACAGAEPRPITGKPDGVRYLIGGDSRDDSSNVLGWSFREAEARGAAAFLFLGDMELTPALDDHFRNTLAQLGPVAFYPVLGNHEVRFFGVAQVAHDQAEAAFRRRFLDTPRTPVHSSIANKVVYGVTLPGGVHFIALDNVSQRGFGREQLDWLEADLTSARADASVHFIIVGMHKPLAHNAKTKHSMDADGAQAVSDSDAAVALLVKHKVSMIVASHVHAYLAFDTAGIPTYITGGLGAPLDRRTPDGAFHHFLQVDVGAEELHVSVVRFDGKPSFGGDGDEAPTGL